MEANTRFMRLTKIKLNGPALKFLPPAYALCIILWVAWHADVYLDPSWILPRDNERHFLPTFLYIVEYAKRIGAFPDWIYTLNGGVWMGALSTNYLFAMPHRWIGCALAIWGGVSPLFAYKISLLFGTFLFLHGLYLLARALSFSLRESAYAVLFALVSAVTLTFLHQEQALGTVAMLPYLGWSALRGRRDKSYWVLFSILLGLALNFHYPQILFVYGVVLVAGGIAALRRDAVIDIKKEIKKARPLFFLAIVLGFVVSASPLFYSYFQYHDRLESPLRAQTESLETSSYADYERINRYVPSSLHPANLLLYFNFFGGKRVEITQLDDNALYMGLGAFWAILAIVFCFFRRCYFLPFTIFALVLASLGIYTLFPRFFWPWAPGISMFRQWYHFSTILNLHILFAGLVGMRMFVQRMGFHVLGKLCVYGGSLVITAWGAHDVVKAVRLQMQAANPSMTGQQLFEFYTFQVVSPRGVDPGALRRANLGRDEIQQFNDGKWVGYGNAPVVSIPIDMIRRGEIVRRRSIWPTLLWAMWLPLAVWAFFRGRRVYEVISQSIRSFPIFFKNALALEKGRLPKNP